MTTAGIGSGAKNIFQANGMQNMRKPPSADEMVSKMGSELNLSDEQKTKLKSILDKNISSMETEMKSRPSQGLDFKSMEAKMKSKMDAQGEEIKSILTPEQLTKFNDIIKSSKPQGFDNSDVSSSNTNSKNGVDFYGEGKVDLYL